MGAFTWMIVIIVILAIIGLGWQVFVSGIFKGAEKIMNADPVLKNTSREAKQYFGSIIKNASQAITASGNKV
jgi:uncharacterized membrane protein